MAHIILFGNEKGGSSKTTSAMHLIMGLIQIGHKVSSIDLDYRQRSLTSYIENRIKAAVQEQFSLPIPEHYVMDKDGLDIDHNAEEETFLTILKKLHESSEFVIIDTPGTDNNLNRLAHSYANTIITPINDSFVDVDLLGKIDSTNLNIVKPGVYSAMLWEQKLKRAARDNKQIDWVVVRNRVAHIEVINKRHIEEVIGKLAVKLGFRIVPGFGDRVIFKELFLHGLTLLDAGITNKIKFNASVIAARQELRNFISALGLPNVDTHLKI